MICLQCYEIFDSPVYSSGNTIRCPNCRAGAVTHTTFMNHVQEETHEWRMEEWPDITALAQTFGTAIEVMELGELVLKGEYYDEDWADEQRLKEEAGDSLVYLLGVMSLLDLTVEECVAAALRKNDDRDWEEHQGAPEAER